MHLGFASFQTYMQYMVYHQISYRNITYKNEPSKTLKYPSYL